jgi:lipoic acid synthetase
MVKKLNPSCKVEVLIPDFKGHINSLKKVLNSNPDVVNHNIEVVENLFTFIRPEGDYERSLFVLKSLKSLDKKILTKSGFMIGIGENWDQILKTMIDLRNSDVDFLTIGQYLQPTKNHTAIKKYYTPKDFEELKNIALNLGFKHVESGPLVRSSYHAADVFC